MTADVITSLDAHEQPSDYLRSQWKAYMRAPAEAVLASGDACEPVRRAATTTTMTTSSLAGGGVDAVSDAGLDPDAPFQVAYLLPAARVGEAFAQFLADRSPADGDKAEADPPPASLVPGADVPVYFHPLLPGLLVVPDLVPARVQTRLLDRMVHRDLSCPRHQTNMHPFYDVPYPAADTNDAKDTTASLFTYPPSTDTTAPSAFAPKDPTIHRPLSIRQVLDRRLHWVTLGGQYDWTRRVYVEGDDGEDDAADHVPSFPPDLARLLAGLFPETRPEAAIVNFYTPGDTMMMHRDVSEYTDKGLVSVSLGCDALFMVAPTGEFADATDKAQEPHGNDDPEPTNEPDEMNSPTTDDANSLPNTTPTKPQPYVLLRLRSGDAVYMTGHARFAWHGVPKVIKGTCPAYLADWPAGEHIDGRYEAWRGWMANKRVNLNVRQMRD
ncbi:2og-Fe oxygenase family protein [Niveomyces insectorum RCEF 264]|uniref:2og-Fe oxygenase family protein n=1 Tax=Niveomyces insectorum RCEF 264 TaxID=1081102 RepID=A0A167SJX5_9HYPO|nr:2og-Fe oxygenase family protein [Niveomyces insectorum RCEF 264]